MNDLEESNFSRWSKTGVQCVRSVSGSLVSVDVNKGLETEVGLGKVEGGHYSKWVEALVQGSRKLGWIGETGFKM